MSKLRDRLSILLAILQLLAVLGSVEADYRLEIRVLSYKNPSHRLIDGQCCDPLLTFCVSECDTHFQFCLRPAGYSEDEGESDCPLWKYTTGEVGQDDITFTESVGSLSNPFLVPVQGNWTGSFQLLTEVHDADTFSAADLVDIIFAAPHNLPAGVVSTKTYGGQGAHIKFQFRVLCATDYYGPSCGTYCTRADSEGDGHYSCNPLTGEIQCLPGFIEPSTNCITAATEGPLPIATTTTDDIITGTAATTSIPSTAASPSESITAGTGATPRPVEPDMTSNDVTTSHVTAGVAANQNTSKRNVGAIVGPLLAVIVVILTVLILVVVLLFWRRRKRSKGYSQDELTVRMLDMQTNITDGIPNATYNPSAMGVVYPTAKASTYERNFDNPLYHSATLTHITPNAAASNGGRIQDSSGLYSTIDNRSPRRS